MTQIEQLQDTFDTLTSNLTVMYVKGVRSESKETLKELGYKLVFLDEPLGRTLGWCNRKTKTIALNATFASTAPYSDAMDTLLHEIAHAMSPFHGHDKYWKRCCKIIGATPSARANLCENFFVQNLDSLKGKYVLLSIDFNTEEVTFIDNKQRVVKNLTGCRFEKSNGKPVYAFLDGYKKFVNKIIDFDMFLRYAFINPRYKRAGLQFKK